MNGPNMLNRVNLQPRLVRLISGLALHQVEEAVALLLDFIEAGDRQTISDAATVTPTEPWSEREALRSIIDAFDSGSSMRDDMLGHAIDAARALQRSRAQAAVDPEGLAERLQTAYNASSAGRWGQGATTHHTVAQEPGKPDYRIAEFRHADDARFCDVAHELTPAIIRELRTRQAQADARGAGA